MFSLTWDTIAMLKISGKDFIMPGEHAEIEISLNFPMFMVPQQRFTLRRENTTIATGVFTEMLPCKTSEEKDKKFVKKLLREEMEKLGFSPYERKWEKTCKPDYSKSSGTTNMTMAALFEENKNQQVTSK